MGWVAKRIRSDCHRVKVVLPCVELLVYWKAIEGTATLISRENPQILSVQSLEAHHWDPMIEEVHEKEMGELKMSNQPAHVYFCKLERLAKLANCHDDETEWSVLVCAVHSGIPPGYTSIIANIGIGVPRMYPEWKERIILMYEQWQKQNVYNQMHGLDPQLNQKQITATSSNKNTTGGATSSSAGKVTGNDKGRDSSGRWTIFAG